MANEKKFILVSIDDKRSKKIAEVLGNKTSKKIIDLLAETSELSEKDISDSLNLPLNTIEYNLKKLLSSEMVEKTKNFFWSKKGKRIPMYRLSGKSIIISPKSSKISSKIKSLLPAILVSGIGAFIIKIFSSEPKFIQDASEEAMLFSAQKSSEMAITPTGVNFISLYSAQPWMWFLAGSLLVIAIFAFFNWRKL
jgi:DNA-binding transcriptional ArsR family regulator